VFFYSIGVISELQECSISPTLQKMHVPLSLFYSVQPEKITVFLRPNATKPAFYARIKICDMAHTPRRARSRQRQFRYARVHIKSILPSGSSKNFSGVFYI
ncbi:MAG: hypothetical protein ACLT5Z_11945, partial [Eisenbergiella sp.]